MVDKGAPSAGEHVYREIQVKVWPTSQGGQTAVWLRARRGSDLVWDRRLGAFGLDAASTAAASTAAGALRAAARALLDAADRMDRL